MASARGETKNNPSQTPRTSHWMIYRTAHWRQILFISPDPARVVPVTPESLVKFCGNGFCIYKAVNISVCHQNGRYIHHISSLDHPSSLDIPSLYIPSLYIPSLYIPSLYIPSLYIPPTKVPSPPPSPSPARH
jgi:hypothetical protein